VGANVKLNSSRRAAFPLVPLPTNSSSLSLRVTENHCSLCSIRFFVSSERMEVAGTATWPKVKNTGLRLDNEMFLLTLFFLPMK
jgi:hypothetical protein